MPPPQTAHVASPASRLLTAGRGGRPDIRPSAEAERGASVRPDGRCTRFHTPRARCAGPWPGGAASRIRDGAAVILAASRRACASCSRRRCRDTARGTACCGPWLGDQPRTGGAAWSVLPAEWLWARVRSACQPLGDGLQAQARNHTLEDAHHDRGFVGVNDADRYATHRIAVYVGSLVDVPVAIAEDPSADDVALVAAPWCASAVRSLVCRRGPRQQPLDRREHLVGPRLRHQRLAVDILHHLHTRLRQPLDGDSRSRRSRGR